MIIVKAFLTYLFSSFIRASISSRDALGGISGDSSLGIWNYVERSMRRYHNMVLTFGDLGPL